MNTYTFNLKLSTEPISDRQFKQLCALNPELKLETNSKGELIIMPPTGSDTGRRNLEIEGQFWYWNRQRKLGVVFDSSTGFTLPNGAKRSPDLSWIAIERWNGLSQEEKRGFAPIAPDFVIELISPTDNLETIRAKMQEYIENNVRLGWLINPETLQIEVYRLGEDTIILNQPNTIADESVLPGLALDLTAIWT